MVIFFVGGLKLIPELEGAPLISRRDSREGNREATQRCSSMSRLSLFPFVLSQNCIFVITLNTVIFIIFGVGSNGTRKGSVGRAWERSHALPNDPAWELQRDLVWRIEK